MQDTVSDVEFIGMLNVNSPSMSVDVPTVVPVTMTLAPGTGSDVALTTLPLTFLFCAIAAVEKPKMTRRMRKKRFSGKNLLFNLIISNIAIGNHTKPHQSTTQI